jgi:SEC-C motif
MGSDHDVDVRLGDYRQLTADDWRELDATVTGILSQAVATNQEQLAKWCWTRKQTCEVHSEYAKAFGQLKAGEYYEGWCTLERSEIAIKFLRPHLLGPEWTAFGLESAIQQIERWQSLFPYKIFASPEIVHHEKHCSICNATIGLRSGCAHRKGEIYMGRICSHVITKPEFLGISFVTKPVQKYSVGFMHDPATGKHKDHYNYSLVRYVAQRLRSPYDGWTAQFTKARHPHERFRSVGRNDPCPCESGLKYKKCCLNEAGVLRPHIQVEFDVPLDPELLQVEYSD